MVKGNVRRVWLRNLTDGSYWFVEAIGNKHHHPDVVLSLVQAVRNVSLDKLWALPGGQRLMISLDETYHFTAVNEQGFPLLGNDLDNELGRYVPRYEDGGDVVIVATRPINTQSEVYASW